jgi:hypothetical protein
MAMRDPGTPGRNPFFEHGPEAFDDPAWAPEPDAAPLGPDDGDPGLPTRDFSWAETVGRDPLGALAALVDGLQHAQPEATEHLVAAAHELVLAVKCVVDATEAALAAQRAAAAESGAASDARAEDPVPPVSGEPEAPTRSGGVRRIDLA